MSKTKPTIFHSPKLIAAMLAIGGAFGAILSLMSIGHALTQSWPATLMTASYIALFCWAVYTGIRLGRGDLYGRKFAAILFASQIPIIETPGLTFQWFTGLWVGLLLKWGQDGGYGGSLSGSAGAKAQFIWGSGGDQIIVGVNLFAAFALYRLLRAVR